MIKGNNLDELLLSTSATVESLMALKASKHYATVVNIIDMMEKKSIGMLINHLASTENIPNKEEVTMRYTSDILSARRIRAILSDADGKYAAVLAVRERELNKVEQKQRK